MDYIRIEFPTKNSKTSHLVCHMNFVCIPIACSERENLKLRYVNYTWKKLNHSLIQLT